MSAFEQIPLDAELAGWLAQGELERVAAVLVERGQLAAAQALYEQAWNLPRATALAQKRGDLLGLLRLALRSPEPGAATLLLPELEQAGPELQQAAAALYEQGQHYHEAARLQALGGQAAAARRLYERDGDWLAVGALDEAAGELGAAAQSYARASESAVGATAAAAAALGSGRVLLASALPEAAIPRLQAAWRQALKSSPAGQPPPAELLDAIDSSLIEALVAAGESGVAQVVLGRYGGRRLASPTAELRPRTVAEFIQQRSQPRTERAELPLLLGRYRLQRLLGAGSMGRVFLAEDRWQRRQVALKLLPLAASPDGEQATIYQRFCREAALLCRLRHPNLVELYDFHPSAGLLTMEYLEAGPLSTQAKPLPLRRLRRLLIDVLEALQLVHGAAVLHRDIKPHNLFLSATGATKLGDFGAASLRELGITQTEGLVGTLAYMSPEQLRGDSLSFATDLYGLGVTLFELCTGALPFPGPDFIEQHLHAAPPDAQELRPELPMEWAALLRQLLAKSAPARGSSLEALQAQAARLPIPALRDDLQGSPPPLEPPPSPQPAPVVSAARTLLLRTAHSTLYRQTDPRLGRELLIERFLPGRLGDEAGAAQLAWLRAMAAAGGALLQRVLRIDETQGEVHYEAPGVWPLPAAGRLTAEERQPLRQLLEALHQRRLCHGSVVASLVREQGRPWLLIAGGGPLSWSPAAPPTAEDDLAGLEG